MELEKYKKAYAILFNGITDTVRSLEKLALSFEDDKLIEKMESIFYIHAKISTNDGRKYY